MSKKLDWVEATAEKIVARCNLHKLYSLHGTQATTVARRVVAEIIAEARAEQEAANARLVETAKEMLAGMGSDNMSLKEYKRWRRAIADAKKNNT
ncbi:MAG: hypothetical protein KAV00_07035 [Phycisphaerae bacterium]|nr:hypothetical protein [Phycisphaerae bacterium]